MSVPRLGEFAALAYNTAGAQTNTFHRSAGPAGLTAERRLQPWPHPAHAFPIVEYFWKSVV